jgi:AraC-like DNA-binding protein
VNEAFPHFRRYQFRDYDPEQLRQVVDGSEMEHTILAAGPCSAMVQQFQEGRVSVDIGFYHFPFVARGQFPRGRVCLGLAWDLKENARANGIEVDLTTFVIHAEGNELLYRAAANSGWMVVAMERAELQAAAMAHFGRELTLPERGFLDIRVPIELASRLVRLIHATSSRLEGAARRDRSATDQALVAACVEAIASGDQGLERDVFRRLTERNQVIRRADAVMRHLVGGEYSSDRLCRTLGVTERTLQSYFKESIGLTPKSWFQRLSLNRAHEALLHRPIHRNLVTEVALDCGFEHFGRFAQLYRELFGRTPSETVQSRLAR